jgi:hypothetical protein
MRAYRSNGNQSQDCQTLGIKIPLPLLGRADELVE